MLRRAAAAFTSFGEDHRGTRRGPVRVTSSSAAGVVALPVESVEAPKVALENICLSYKTNSGERLQALQNIFLDVRCGEFLCIVGPSGCGKSTLLHLIAGLHRQTAGEVRIDNEAVQGPGNRSHSHIPGAGFVSLADGG
jgi:ABC-type glutathione transport system ATPase component